MATNIANIRKDKWLTTLFDENFIIRKTNDYVIANGNTLIFELIQEKFDNDEDIKKEFKSLFGNSRESKKKKNKYINKLQKEKYKIKYLKETQIVLKKVENQIRLKMKLMEMVDIEFLMDFYCKTVFSNSLIVQDHLPFIFLEDKDFIKFSYEFKLHYGYTEREIEVKKSINEFCDGDENEKLNKICKKRLLNLRNRCKLMNYPLPKSEMFKKILKESFDNGFKCHYCKNKMRIIGKKERKGNLNIEDIFTFEHIKPLSKGGVHSFDNVVVCCRTCNTIKSNMDEEIFLRLVDEISDDTKYKLYLESEHLNQVISSKMDYLKDLVKRKDKEILELKRKNKTLLRTNKHLMDKC